MEKILKYTSIIYAILFFIGFLSDYIYYASWGIEINHYFTNSEIFLSFLNSSVGLLILIFFTFTFFIETLFNNGFRKRLSNKNHRWLLILILVVLSVHILISTFNENTITFSQKSTISLFPLLTIIFSFVYIRIIINKKRDNIFIANYQLSKQKLKQALLYSTIFFFILTFITYNKISRTISSKHNVSFNYNENQISSDTSILYLGASYNYIFLYNKETMRTMIFERRDITNLEFQ